jgi:hypothetical protein
MATKYIVIPEDMYRNLIQNQKDVKISAEQSKSELEKVKRSRNRNLSAKNVQYNQELRRYLKTKKEEEEKPINVKLTNGLEGIIKKSVDIPKASFYHRSQVGSVNDNPDEEFMIDNREYDMEEQTPHAPFVTPKSHKSAMPAEQYEYREATPVITTTQEKYDQLVQIISQDPEKYKVMNGKIMNERGNPVKYSNYMESLKHALQSNKKFSPGSPAGTSLLMSRLRSDPETSKILAKKVYGFGEINQGGSGIIKKKKKIFKPQLWTRLN